ncbi:MAG: hypothetical protein HC783_13305 [Rhodobacteraceae bacterium]|nr:hypothetical protein [Paracoccaceae bacterium]
MTSPVPAEWTRMIGSFRAAQVAQDQMKDPAASQQVRDDATIRYSRAVDQVIADLGTLSERQVLGRITLFLSKRER